MIKIIHCEGRKELQNLEKSEIYESYLVTCTYEGYEDYVHIIKSRYSKNGVNLTWDEYRQLVQCTVNRNPYHQVAKGKS